jgi:hypothetical protein
MSLLRRAAMVLAIAGTVLAVQPGVARAAPYWQTFTTNSTWHCGATTQHRAVAGFYFQACNVKNASDYMQTVLVVNNQTGRAVTIAGDVVNSFGFWSCYSSGFNTGYKRACFGGTRGPIGNCSYADGYGVLAVNGVEQATVPATRVYARCDT